MPGPVLLIRILTFKISLFLEKPLLKSESKTFKASETLAPESNKKSVFINKLRSEIDRLVVEGRLTEEQGKDKFASAELVEKGFSDDP